MAEHADGRKLTDTLFLKTRAARSDAALPSVARNARTKSPGSVRREQLRCAACEEARGNGEESGTIAKIQGRRACASSSAACSDAAGVRGERARRVETTACRRSGVSG
jgi:hypothetical protein